MCFILWRNGQSISNRDISSWRSVPIRVLGIDRFREITGRLNRGLNFFLGFEEDVPDQLMDYVKDFLEEAWMIRKLGNS